MEFVYVKMGIFKNKMEFVKYVIPIV